MTVITVATNDAEAVALARWGFHIARAEQGPLIVVVVRSRIATADAETRVDSYRPDEGPGTGDDAVIADVCSALNAEARSALRPPPAGENADAAEDPAIEIRGLTSRDPLAAILAMIRDDSAAYVIVGHQQTRRGDDESLGRRVFESAPCHTILLRLGESDGTRCRGILVPTHGGPHARVGLRLGERLARTEGGTVTALLVVADEGEFAQEVGERLLAKATLEAGIDKSDVVRSHVALAERSEEAIALAAGDDHDLVLLGASQVGAIRRALFGTVPGRLLSGPRPVAVGVIRRRWSLAERVRSRVGEWLDLTIPQMSREDRLTVYERIQVGSEWNFDFLALMGLSTGIATVGLLQNSAAVVIGAMLVAPLMMPVLGAGLALVQGNRRLIQTAARLIVMGYVTALAIAMLMALLMPSAPLTDELAARGGPTLLDMLVAFLSGLAAAYCLGRPGLSAALPGVAIAAALVPPIATTGVAVRIGALHVAQGAALLFATNVVAIVVGAAVSLYAGGARGRRTSTAGQRWVRWSVLGLLAATVVLAVSLTTDIARGLPGIPDELRAELALRVSQADGVTLAAVDGDRMRGRSVVEVDLESGTPPPPELLRDVAAIVHAHMPRARVRVSADLAVEY